MKFFKICMLAMSMVTFNAHAVLIGITDNGSYLSDASSGLDWLDVTTSINRSFNDVSSQFGVGGDYVGWRYATAAEFGALLKSTGVTGSITGRGQITRGTLSKTSAREIISMLGDTLDAFIQGAYGQSFCERSPSSCPDGDAMYTNGILADAYPPDPRSFGNPSLRYFAGIRANDRVSTRIIYDAFTNGRINDTVSSSGLGSYLVRNTTTATVLEPPVMLLFAAGLLGMIVVRRRRV